MVNKVLTHETRIIITLDIFARQVRHLSQQGLMNKPTEIASTNQPCPESGVVERSALLGFRNVPMRADKPCNAEDLKELHNKVGFGEVPPPPAPAFTR